LGERRALFLGAYLTTNAAALPEADQEANYDQAYKLFSEAKDLGASMPSQISA